MDPALRLQPGQQALTRAQEAEARRFAERYIQTQLSTDPVNEQEAEAFLHQAYQAAAVPPPLHISWLDGPLQLVAALAPQSVWDSVRNLSPLSVVDRVHASIGDLVEASVWNSVWESVGADVYVRVGACVGDLVEASVWASVGDSLEGNGWASDSVRASTAAYYDAPSLAVYRFFDGYLAPNALQALAHFNELVSGYWVGEKMALLVRRPYLLARNGQGRLHSTTGKSVEYRDGWGFYAWHGVRVPEKVILAPERLSREDWLQEPNVEIRRVMQERMGGRLVRELDGVVIDTSPRGTLYEIRLPADDPEQVALYVQVQDASTARQYFLRVPPTVQTAAEAVAWSFQVAVEEYGPAQET